MLSPIQWYGGKGKVVKRLLNYVPPHEHYVEVFGGGGSLLFAKQPCHGTETFNDIDSGLINFFRVLKDPVQFEVFRRLVSFTLYSREEFEQSKTIVDNCKDNIHWAYHWYIIARMSISGIHGSSWGYSVSTAHYSAPASRYASSIDRLPQICDRLRSVQIENKGFRDLIPRHIAPNTLIYCDPPYLPETRGVNTVYKHEMSREDHEGFLVFLLSYPQMVILSSYANSLYDKYLSPADWKRYTISTKHPGLIPGIGKPSPNELLWLNPLAQSELHRAKQLNLF